MILTRYLSSSENLAGQRSRLASSIRSFFANFIDICLFYFGLKTFLNLILQCVYVHLQRDSNQELKDEENSGEFASIVRRMMQIIGQQYRGIGTTGVCYYSLNMYSWVFYYFIEKVSIQGWLKRLLNGGLLSFLDNPEKERDIIMNRIDLLIKNLIESNINFTRIVIGQEKTTDIQRFNQRLQLFDHRKTFRRAQLTQPISRRATLTSITATTSVVCDNENAALRRMAHEVSVDSLTSQLKHLNELKSDTSRLWPPNRELEWRNYIKRMWLKLHLASYVNIWFACMICVCFAIQLAYEALIESSLDKSHTKFQIIDRVSSVDAILYCWIAADWFSSPLTVAIISILDQFKFSNSFETRLSSIRSRIVKLATICENKNKSIINLHDVYIEKLIRDMKIKCDNEVVEFYILYRLFRKDLGNTLELAQENLAKSISFLASTLLTTLIFYDRLDIDQIPVLIFIIAICMVSLDCVFILYAALHTSSCRITKLVWLLITSAEIFCLKGLSDQSLGINNETTVETNPSLASNHLNLYAIDNFDFEYYSHSLISPHTVFLLRKIAANHVFLANSCVCRLYGLIPLDYRGIMKINFWLVSSILLALTYYN